MEKETQAGRGSQEAWKVEGCRCGHLRMAHGVLSAGYSDPCEVGKCRCKKFRETGCQRCREYQQLTGRAVERCCRHRYELEVDASAGSAERPCAICDEPGAFTEHGKRGWCQKAPGSVPVGGVAVQGAGPCPVPLEAASNQIPPAKETSRSWSCLACVISWELSRPLPDSKCPECGTWADVYRFLPVVRR